MSFNQINYIIYQKNNISTIIKHYNSTLMFFLQYFFLNHNDNQQQEIYHIFYFMDYMLFHKHP